MRKFLSQNRSVIQFGVFSLSITIVAAVIAGAILERRGRDHLIRSHLKVYPVLVDKVLDRNPALRSRIAEGSIGGLQIDAQGLFGEFLALGTVFRIKIWGVDGTVLWSDTPEIIGKVFSDNEHFQSARSGTTSYAVEHPPKREHEAEISAGPFMEIYVPVDDHGKIVGVLELYERNAQLFANIDAYRRSIWSIIGGFGGVLFLSLFFIYGRADASLNRAISNLEQTQQVTILALAYQAELRDAETGRHIERTSHYVRILAEGIHKSGRYPGYMGGPYIEDIIRSAPLHDIGKVAIPDSILRKPERLTPEEYEVIKKHCEYGVRVLDEAHADLPFQTFLVLARQLILHHHERWDGTGYPSGLAGEKIPLSGRIMAVADVYDALRSLRPYKEPLPHDVCVEIITQDSGKQFDPGIVKIFIEVAHQFEQISTELDDAPVPAGRLS